MTLPKTLLLIYPGAMLLEYVDYLPHYILMFFKQRREKNDGWTSIILCSCCVKSLLIPGDFLTVVSYPA